MREPQKRENLVQATDCSVAEAMDSHFISAALSLGWETSRCQIRAWNDSVCGVMVSGLITGIRTQASDTWAVNPPSRPTMPQIRAPTCLAYCRALNRLAQIPRSASPPPTEKTK